MFLRLVQRILERLRHGRLHLVFDGHARTYGDPASRLDAELRVHDESFFRDVVLQGEIGLGRSYVAGKWSSPDLENLTLVLQLNVDAFLPMMRNGKILLFRPRLLERLKQTRLWRQRRSTLEHVRDKMASSYGVGNDFFRYVLGPCMQYSCAIWASAGDSLEQAQQHKIDVLIDKLGLSDGHRVLDVGCGWGTLLQAIRSRYDCAVRGIAAEQKQIEYCRDRLPEGRFDRLDYRDLTEEQSYDRIVSVGMIEHVGHDYVQTFMDAVARLLKPGGRAVLHTIIAGQTIDVEPGVHFDTFVSSTVMPVGYIPTYTELTQAIYRSKDLHPIHLECFGQHYGKTMREWRRNLLDHAESIAGLYSEEHVRTYDYIYGLNSGSFTAGNLDLLQIVVEKGPPSNDMALYDPRA